jgi:isochorismate hydrolase
MGIASVPPYPMPIEDELPRNTVSWRVDPHRAVLLVHDMQKYFLEPFHEGKSPRTELLQNTSRLVRAFAATRTPVAYTAQPGGMTDEQRGLLKDIWGPGMAAAPEHRAIAEDVAPRKGDHVFTKWRYSAFHRTGLLDLLRNTGRDQLVICGVYAHVGCLTTANDAFAHDIEAFLVADAMADFSRRYHDLALSYAAERCAATPTTDTVLQAWETPGSTMVVSGQLHA